MAKPGLESTARRFLPILDWVPGYRRDWLLPDFLAGVALRAVMVSEGMAYAGIVGVPPIMGLYTIVPAFLACALLGTSRQLVVGPDTATGLISALMVGAVVTQGTPDFNSLTSTLAVLIGFFLWRRAHGMGSELRSLLPLRGFIEGLVYVTIIGQCRICSASAALRAIFLKSSGISCTICRTFRPRVPAGDPAACAHHADRTMAPCVIPRQHLSSGPAT
jgi:MFS superfamily sulfate permease-like transporter